ncbi:heparinase II/III domain-containing protein [Candidatus Formimonas warabiya]|uniref:Uncharacterized protein n=1 Tax=Formimonas warabiya TaxID=1761012 RepID=A0A3G1KPV1_FORW1|nr:heparinase II/III family protein [Candidatus Formimonas warabiya]ATW24499.1 hypothetical protein DCMF_06640 [Candidatus Formimonas warabiya]
MIKSLFTEYGLPWVINRSLYSAKLKMMTAIPATEQLFEKKVHVKRINIFNLNVAGIKVFLCSLSREKQIEIVSVADKAIEGVISGFSSIELDYGNPINWHYNPLTKVESNRSAKWFRIPDFDAELGDIKVVWEASRFTHFFYFSRAYLITGDKKYYYAFAEQLEQWLKDNPYSYGVNYKCGQECTLRMINTLMAYTVFKHYGIITVKDEENTSKLVEVCYKKVLANFFYAHKCIQNNHTLSEICGLIIGAWCCCDKKRLNKAYGLLDKEVQKQFLPDGGYIQYSFNYQRFALQIMECIFKLSERTNMYIAEGTKDRIKKSAVFMYQMQDESGEMPNYGPNDGALIFPVTACGYRDFRPVLNTVYSLIEGRRLYEQGDYDEELLWFGNGDIDSEHLASIKKEPSSFYESGFYTLHHDDGFLMTVLQDYRTRPAQMDELHIDLWHKGKNIFCDSGTYSYASEIGKEMALTAAHNTVQVDDKDQMKKRGAFMIYDWTECRDVKYTKDSFSGTMVSKNSYTHRRAISKVGYGYAIEDEINGNGEYCEFYFHTPCEVRLVRGGFELFENNVLICTVEADNGDIVSKKSYRSLYYLKNIEINCVSVRCSMDNKKCRIRFDIKLI